MNLGGRGVFDVLVNFETREGALLVCEWNLSFFPFFLE